MEHKRIEYYDSLGGNNDTYFTTMRQYLRDEYAAHHTNNSSCHAPPPLQLSEWSHYCPKHIPRQDNGSDCGVFTLKFADYLSHNPKPYNTRTAEIHHPQQQQHSVGGSSSDVVVSSKECAAGEQRLDFSASDMEYFRNRIALEIKLQRVM